MGIRERAYLARQEADADREAFRRGEAQRLAEIAMRKAKDLFGEAPAEALPGKGEPWYRGAVRYPDEVGMELYLYYHREYDEIEFYLELRPCPYCGKRRQQHVANLADLAIALDNVDPNNDCDCLTRAEQTKISFASDSWQVRLIEAVEDAIEEKHACIYHD